MIWLDEDKTELARLLKAGFSSSEIGEWFGVSKHAVIGLVRRDPVLSKIGFAHGPGGTPKRPGAKPVTRGATDTPRYRAGLSYASKQVPYETIRVRQDEMFAVIHRTDATSVLMGDPPAYDPRREKWAKHLARID